MIIYEDVLLADRTWFKTGGAARFFCQPTDAASCAQALLFAKEKGLATFVLGQGANILLADRGFDGLVIQPMINTIVCDKVSGLVTAGAGASMSDVINEALDHHLVGLEVFSGIPGSVGGSVYINIHYFDALLSSFLVFAQVIEYQTGTVFDVDNAWFSFGYNASKLQQGSFFLVSATFKLASTDAYGAAYAKGQRDATIAHRIRRYPAVRTCGSFFRNFNIEELALAKQTVPFVAYYLDNVGVKGALLVGGASVSSRHANMIETRHGATSTDVFMLARKMQELVFKKFGLMPQPECQLVGFDRYPLCL